MVMAVMVVVSVRIHCLGHGQSSGRGRDGWCALAVAATVVDTVDAATSIAVTGGGCSRGHGSGCGRGGGCSCVNKQAVAVAVDAVEGLRYVGSWSGGRNGGKNGGDSGSSMATAAAVAGIHNSKNRWKLRQRLSVAKARTKVKFSFMKN